MTPGHHRLALTLAPLLVALALIAAGCGSGGGSTPTVKPPKPTKSLVGSRRALERAPCPAPYLAIDRKTTYSHGEIAKARAGTFDIKGHPTKLVPPIDWSMDPYNSKSFRGVLAGMKWIDALIYAARRGDRAALAQARDIALDWVEHNPRHQPPTDKSWENKIIGDRAKAMLKSSSDIFSRSRASVVASLPAIAGRGRNAVSRSGTANF